MGETKKPFHNPFAALGALRETLPEGKAAPPKPAQEKESCARAVVRLERAGRGGREVTLIEHLDLPAEVRQKWLKELKSAMGCGGALEDEAIVLQGDLRERVAQWLEKKAVRKVVVAN